jgi:hypothetical protein
MSNDQPIYLEWSEDDEREFLREKECAVREFQFNWNYARYKCVIPGDYFHEPNGDKVDEI